MDTGLVAEYGALVHGGGDVLVVGLEQFLGDQDLVKYTGVVGTLGSWSASLEGPSHIRSRRIKICVVGTREVILGQVVLYYS